MRKVIFVLLLACFIMPSMVMAAQTQWGYTAGPLAGYWTTAADYRLGAVPVADDEQMIYSGDPAKTCILDVATPTITNIRMYKGSVLDIIATGALIQNGVYSGGYDAGTSADMIIRTGGSYENLSTATGSPTVRLGCLSGAAATIIMEVGSSFKAMGMKVAYTAGSTGKVNLFGGDLELMFNSNGALYLNADGKIEMKDTGKLIIAGDRQALINGYISNGYLYTSQEGMALSVNYDGLKTTVTVVIRTPIQALWGYNETVAGYWSTMTDWNANVKPLYNDSVRIYSGSPANTCVLDEATPLISEMRIYNGAVLDIQTGGAINSNSAMLIGYDANSTAELKVSGGSYYSSDTTTSSPRTRVGFASGSHGILTITDGIYSTYSLMVPYATGATGIIKIYGGTLELRWNSGGCLQLNYAGRTGGSIDLRAPGKLTVTGDQRAWLLNPKIVSGEIYTSEPGAFLVLSYDGNKSIVQAIKSYSDLNRDSSVNFVDLSLLADEWMQIRATDKSQSNPNRLIFAPETSPITVDGSFGVSEWANSSEWAEFGKWYPGGEGLSSKTKARYAWNDAADMLYIAIESTEPNEYAKFQVGGLMGELGEPLARPSGCWQATEINFQYDGASVVITNPYDDGYLTGITTGIVAAHTFDGTTMRLEIATPIYSDWTDSGTVISLSAGMDIYTYINILSGITGTLKGDSQCAEMGQVDLYNGISMERSSAIRLLSSLPATCADVPFGLSNYADFAGDCYVDMADLAVFIEDWLNE